MRHVSVFIPLTRYPDVYHAQANTLIHEELKTERLKNTMLVKDMRTVHHQKLLVEMKLNERERSLRDLM